MKISDSEPIDGIVFRVAEMYGDVCQRAIWCRVEKREDDWKVSLHRYERDAHGAWRPMTEVPEDLIGLAIRAMGHADGWLQKHASARPSTRER